MKKFQGDREKLKASIRCILEYLGEDPSREGLADTPERVAKSYDRLFGGYLQSPEEILTVFEKDNVIPKGQIILLKDIEFYSTCEHHLLPFYGKAHVAYMPGDKIVGISKLARLVEIFSRRLQIQERVGLEVAESLMSLIEPKGSACIIESRHLCMTCRGVEKENSTMITSSLKGVFLENDKTRQELMSLIFR